MSRSIPQRLALAAYAGLAKSGLMRLPVMRAAFHAAYGVYKRLIEAGPVDALQAYAPVGSAVFDVGANIGFFTSKFAGWVGPNGIVYAIEPDADNFSELGRCIAKAGYEGRVKPFRAVAAEQRGVLRLQRNDMHPADHKIALDGSGEDVDAVTLDDLASQEARPVSLVKIDVQGAEMMVLRGASTLIAQHRPALFVEVDDQALRRFGSSARDVATYVSQWRYTPHLLQRDGSATPIDEARYDSLCAEGRYFDVLFLAEPAAAA